MNKITNKVNFSENRISKDRGNSILKFLNALEWGRGIKLECRAHDRGFDIF